MSSKKDKVKFITAHWLYVSMCAVFPTTDKTKDFTDGKGLLYSYITRQIRKKRFDYVKFCQDNKQIAYRTAQSVFDLRNPVHDVDYYDLTG